MTARRREPDMNASNRRSSRREALKALVAGSVGVTAALCRSPRSAPARSEVQALPGGAFAAGRPNIVLILLDDMRADDLDAMPAVQSLLLSEGSRFQNAMVASPLCAPARASILRGQYPHNHGVLRGNGDLGGFDLFHTSGSEESTIATWLQDAGYRTALFGKYLNGYPDGDGFPAGVTAGYIPPGWDEWVGMTDEGFFRFEVNDGGQPKRFRTGKKRQHSAKRQERNWYTPSGRTRYSLAGKRKHPYSTDLFAAKALHFVERTAQSEQPFFMYVAPYAVHGPAEPAARHAAATTTATAPRTPAFNELDVSDKPRWVQQTPALSEGQIADLDEDFALRLGTLLAVDEFVRALVDRLSESRILDNTYIMLTSDNGYLLGEHRQVAKGAPYNEAIQVPLVVRGPNIPAGKTIDSLVSQIDLAPTFAEWADAAAPEFVDGRSLAPLLQEPQPLTMWRRQVLVEHHLNRSGKADNAPAFQALRSQEWLYAEYQQSPRRCKRPGSRKCASNQPSIESSTPQEPELYDLVADPFQLQNRIGAADLGTLESLSSGLARLATCRSASCRETEDSALIQDPPASP